MAISSSARPAGLGPTATSHPGDATEAIVLVDHGSRRSEANSVVEETAALLGAALPGRHVEPAHCEIASPTLPEAVARCVELGARHIVVQPFYLVPGRHSREDIPRIVHELAARHREVRFSIGEPLGVHDALVTTLAERIAAASEVGAAIATGDPERGDRD